MDEEFAGQDQPDQANVAPGVGQRLQAARLAKGMTVAQLAAQTRISSSHIDHIEAGEFDRLPARIYAVSFSKNMARVVGLDPAGVAEQVRGEMGHASEEPENTGYFTPGDPAREPSRKLLWFSLFAILLLLAGLFVFNRVLFSPAAQLGPEPTQTAQPAAGTPDATPSAGASAPTSGPVVFTALEDGLWVKFYDGAGEQLMQKQMARGERYTVPADAVDPQVWTGRPDALAITVGGRRVPKLSEEDRIIRDVPVSAAALLARPAATTSATSTPTPRPSVPAG